jgi:tRNA(adenine34) deaminase
MRRPISKRLFLGGLVCIAVARPARATLPPISMAQHERCMRLAIVEARRNPAYPFGAVIVRPDTSEVLARGVNNSRANPILHGEMPA